MQAQGELAAHDKVRHGVLVMLVAHNEAELGLDDAFLCRGGAEATYWSVIQRRSTHTNTRRVAVRSAVTCPPWRGG